MKETSCDGAAIGLGQVRGLGSRDGAKGSKGSGMGKSSKGSCSGKPGRKGSKASKGGSKVGLQLEEGDEVCASSNPNPNPSP